MSKLKIKCIRDVPEGNSIAFKEGKIYEVTDAGKQWEATSEKDKKQYIIKGSKQETDFLETYFEWE